MFCLLPFSESVETQMTEHLKAPSLYQENMPKFEDYPTAKEFHSLPASADLSSHPEARKFERD
jgi:hypothetical protein